MNACGLQPPDLRWLVTAATGDSCGWGCGEERLTGKLVEERILEPESEGSDE